jgi:hypothetical protein
LKIFVTENRPMWKRHEWGSFSVWILILRSEGRGAEPVALQGSDSGAVAFAARDRFYPMFRDRMQAWRI